MKYAIIALLILMLSGCQFYRQDITGDIKVRYEAGDFVVLVYFEDQKTFETIRQGLYWHSELIGHVVSIDSEEFLKKVLPLIDTDVTSVEPLVISEEEAITFYKNRFKAVSRSLKTSSSSDEFHVEIEGIE
jgi:hypothetical protein